MSETYAKILQDSSGNSILPYTRSSLVYMNDNNNLQTTMEYMNSWVTSVQNSVVNMTNPSLWGKKTSGDFLSVAPGDDTAALNAPYFFMTENAGADWTNSPISSGAFYGYRVVRCNNIYSSNHLTTVEIHEQFPIAGRIWSNTYNMMGPQWYGWSSNGDVDYKTVYYGTLALGPTAPTSVTWVLPSTVYKVLNVEISQAWPQSSWAAANGYAACVNIARWNDGGTTGCQLIANIAQNYTVTIEVLYK